MKFTFEAKIYKVGINPCVDVPFRITGKMKASKGYIRVKGKIKDHPFEQTLVPVKNAEYRLYVNGPMLRGSDSKVGDMPKFTIEQDREPETMHVSMPKAFKKKLDSNKLLAEFKKLIPSRQKEILKYLNYLKTKEALDRNIDKVIGQLKSNNK